MPGLIKKFGATRLVVDSITLFEMMFADEAERRLNLFELFSLLKDTGVTALITSEADKEACLRQPLRPGRVRVRRRDHPAIRAAGRAA